MKKIYCLFLVITLLGVHAFSQDIDLKANIGIEKLTAFPHIQYLDNNEYHAWDLFDNNQYYSFSIYYKKYDYINIGLIYSTLTENINKDIFPSSYRLSGNVIVNKFGVSLLFGKTFHSKYHPYFILEPSYYHTKDDTEIKDDLGSEAGGWCRYIGHNFYGLGIGLGFDYYFYKYIGLSSSAKFDIGIYDFDFKKISYPSIQIGIVFTPIK
jgi:hypothetical protein